MDFNLNSLIELTKSLPEDLKDSLKVSLSILFETKDQDTKMLAWHTVIDLILWDSYKQRIYLAMIEDNNDGFVEKYSFDVLEKNKKELKDFLTWLQKPKGLNVEIYLGK